MVEHNTHTSILDNLELGGGSAIDPNEPPRKLAVLGLPWDTRFVLRLNPCCC